MADRAHKQTDALLAEMEARLAEIYGEASKETEAKLAEYMATYQAADDERRALLEDGKMTAEEYAAWRQGKIMTGRHWTNLANNIARELSAVNETALAYINGRLPEVYAVNYNGLAGVFDGLVRGYTWELVNQDVVRRLAKKDRNLLPLREIDGVKDMRWNVKQISSTVLQGILQGESMDQIAARMARVTDMDRVSAIRNARTSVTCAENKGRMDGFERAEADGIRMVRIWISTNDGRTRHAHRLLQGKTAEMGKPFDSELGDIMYPGDPEADPANVYNCRCTLGCRVLGFGKATEQFPAFESTELQTIEEPKNKNDNILTASENRDKINEQAKTRTKAVAPKASKQSENVKIGSDLYSEESRKNLLRSEMINNGNKKETAYVYDADGKLKFKVRGNEDSVTFTAQQIKDMKGCVISHNHPSNSCFSPADINMLRRSGASEIRAGTRYGTYVLQRPKKWSSDIGTLDKIDQEYNSFVDKAILKYKDKAAQDGLHPLYYLQEAEVEGTANFAKAYGLNFKLEIYDVQKLQL